MTPLVSAWVNGLPLALALMAAVWVASVPTRDASLVDRFWGLGFVLLGWFWGWQDVAMSATGLQWLVLALVSVWGVRLSLFITWRNWGHGEDPRYRAMRDGGGPRWAAQSLVTVFGLQGALLWLLAAPLAAALLIDRPPVPWLVAAGVACWVVGLVFEAGGDWQLARFKANPANKGRVLDTGLWRYTRHPNYFGDAMCWWGYFLLAASVGAWWTVFSPVLMTLLLMKVSGVALLEKTLLQTKPQYRDYVARTSAFVPWPRRSR